MNGTAEPFARERDRWRTAGERLWASAMADPDTYRRLAEAVGAAVDRLRAAEDLDALAALAEQLQGDDAAIATVVGAACAIRADEIDARARGAARTAAIADARRAGRAWAVLDDGPLRWVEMHLVTGRALVATVDPHSGEGPYALEEVVLDTTTATLRADGPDGRERFGDEAAWRRRRERRRREIDDLASHDHDEHGGG